MPSRLARHRPSLPLFPFLPLALLGCASDPPSPRDAAIPDIPSLDATAIPDIAASPDSSPSPDIAHDLPSSDSPDIAHDAPPAACGLCATRAEPETSGFLTDGELDELSGLVESRAQPGIYFVHNDSGDTARFFAIDGHGTLRGTYVLRGASAVDWEDLALGPCPAGTCLYLGDVGDNDLVRSSYALYRVAQPVVADGPASSHNVTWERFVFAYPDGRHNVEALAVRPDTGDVYLFTKVTTLPSVVYRFPNPLLPGVTNTLARVGPLALPGNGNPLVTGADLHPCEPRLLVRTYDRLWQFVLPSASAPFEDLFRATPERLLVQTETQGEAVGWHADGRGYVTISEGVGQGLHDARCAR